MAKLGFAELDGGGTSMCLNCGCGDYRDKRGNETNLTMEDVEKAADGEGMSVDDTVKEMMDALPKALDQLNRQRR